MKNRLLLLYLTVTNFILMVLVCMILTSESQSSSLIRSWIFSKRTGLPLEATSSPPNVTDDAVSFLEFQKKLMNGEVLLSHFASCFKFPDYYETCPEGTGLVLVASAPLHQSAREAIRLTWGEKAESSGLWVRFLVGASTDPSVQSMLNKEMDDEGDIVLSDCIDSYDNLTLKTVSMLKWVSSVCPRGSFVLKCDDDIFLNVDNLVKFSRTERYDNTFVGRLATGWKPHRDPSSKYYISRGAFPDSVFPDFITGPAYLFPAVLAEPLYRASLNTTFLKLEDVFLTGVVAKKLGVKRRGDRNFLNEPRRVRPLSQLRRAITDHNNSPEKLVKIWSKLNLGRKPL